MYAAPHDVSHYFRWSRFNDVFNGFNEFFYRMPDGVPNVEVTDNDLPWKSCHQIAASHQCLNPLALRRNGSYGYFYFLGTFLPDQCLKFVANITYDILIES